MVRCEDDRTPGNLDNVLGSNYMRSSMITVDTLVVVHHTAQGAGITYIQSWGSFSVLRRCYITWTRRKPVGLTTSRAVCWRNWLKNCHQSTPTSSSAPLTQVNYLVYGRQRTWPQYTRRVQWVRQWTIALLASLVFLASYLNIYCVHISVLILIVTRPSPPLIMDSGRNIRVRHSSYSPYKTC